MNEYLYLKEEGRSDVEISSILKESSDEIIKKYFDYFDKIKNVSYKLNKEYEDILYSSEEREKVFDLYKSKFQESGIKFFSEVNFNNISNLTNKERLMMFRFAARSLYVKPSMINQYFEMFPIDRFVFIDDLKFRGIETSDDLKVLSLVAQSIPNKEESSIKFFTVFGAILG